MKLEEVKVGKKYRISFKDGDKTVTVYARVTGNDFKKKILKFETKDKLYDGRWDEFDVQTLVGFWTKRGLDFLTGSASWYNKPFWGWLVICLTLLAGWEVIVSKNFHSFLVTLCTLGILFLVQIVPFIHNIWKDRFGWRFWGKIGLVIIGLTPVIQIGMSCMNQWPDNCITIHMPRYLQTLVWHMQTEKILTLLFFVIGLWAVIACFSSRIRQAWRWVLFACFCLFPFFIANTDVGYSSYDKPIIYLYPEQTTDVVFELGYPGKTTHTYPKYQGSWQVQAAPNGDLTDLKTGRHYYALYWEGENTVSTPDFQEGFVVAGSDTIAFLEEKLAELGLTEREAEEFIVYWLPKLESAPYNLIRFQTVAEQNENMPLGITPAPETLIRVMMEYRNLEQPVQVPEQILPETPQRKGFTVVEWGGTEVKSPR